MLREMKLGDGTIAYHGESPEYWAAKTAHWRRGRFLITLGLALAGLLIFAYAASPLGPRVTTATVTQVVAPEAGQPSATVFVSYGVGRSIKSAQLSLDEPAASVGQQVRVVVHAGGRLTEDASNGVFSLWMLGLALVLVAAGRAAWAWLRPGRVRFA